jgi:hypothetical protein
MNFSEKTKKRLSEFKNEKFPGLENGKWKKNNKSYPHILPEENKLDNLLQPYKNEFIDFLKTQNIKLHSDFHHLNSSQAMCFNFFFPLYYERNLEIITDFLGFKNETINYDSVCFEKDGLEAEFGRQPTSFDFYFKTQSGKKLFFEIKYTEGGYGKAKINSGKFDQVYSNFLKPINFNFHNPQPFFDNYQILRNLVHIDENSYVIFIFPKDNNSVKKDSERVKSEFLIENFQEHFFSVYWESIFSKVSDSMTISKMSKQYSDFKEKYLP